MREGPLRLGLRGVAAAADHAADPDRLGLSEGCRSPRTSAARTTTTAAGSTGGERSGGGRASRATSAAASASPAGWSTTTRSCRTSGRPPGRRPSTWSRAGCARSTPLGGPGAIAGFGSAKCSNEEAYLFQKLIRTGFGTNNVDHCTRLCHASSVCALFEGVGSGAVSTTYGDVANADCRDHHRLQPDRQPPGGQLVLQAGPPPRHEGHLRRPAGVHGGRARRHLRAAQARHRRGALQRA